MSTPNKTRGKYRFNIIDIMLLAVIAVSIIAIVFLFFYDGKKENTEDKVDTVEIIYTVEQTEIPGILRGKVNRGEAVVSGNGAGKLGQVIDVEPPTNFVYVGYDEENDRLFEAEHPGKINIRVKISAEAVVNEDGFYTVDGQLVNVGEKMNIRFPFYTGEFMCVSVSEVSE